MEKEVSIANEKVGVIASNHPGAISVFLEHNIDFCCGGELLLWEACERKVFDTNFIWDEIQKADALIKQEIAWNKLGKEDLIVQIENYFHQRHKKDFPHLLELSAKVEKRHKEHELCPYGLTKFLQYMFQDLSDHMQKEEQILFPMMREDNPNVMMPMNAMRMEHQEVGRHIAKIQELCYQFCLPDDACPSWQALYAGLQRFIHELMEHVHVENNILFKIDEEKE